MIEKDFDKIEVAYGLECHCEDGGLLAVEIFNKIAQVHCLLCWDVWQFERKLPEETGPQIASVFRVTKNHGHAQAMQWGWLRKVKVPRHVFTCPDCQRGNVLAVLEVRTCQHGRFWACPNWNYGAGCKYTRNFQSGEEFRRPLAICQA